MTGLPRPDYVASVKSVEAGAGEVLLRLAQGSRADGFLFGRFEDRAGRVAGQERVRVLLNTTGRPVARAEVEDGAFRIGPVPPGVYILWFVAGNTQVLSSGPVELAAGQELDLGTLATALPGSLIVDVTLAAGVEGSLDHIDVLVIDFKNMNLIRLVHDGTTLRSDEVSPGRYNLMVAEMDVAVDEASFEVRAGEETRIQAELVPATRRTFEVRAAAAAEPFDSIRIVVRSPSGETVFDMSRAARDLERDGSIHFEQGFPRGTSEVKFETDSGLSAIYRVEIIDVEDEDPSPIVVELSDAGS